MKLLTTYCHARVCNGHYIIAEYPEINVLLSSDHINGVFDPDSCRPLSTTNLKESLVNWDEFITVRELHAISKNA